MTNRVARYQADRTNQKLYFVRLYCQQAEACEQEQLKLCHTESAILHLYGGYLAFLQEIARYYNITQTQPTLVSIANALENKTQVSPEVIRLEKLLANDFLGEIVLAWQHIQYKPTPHFEDNPNKVTDKDSITSNRLPAIDIMANSLAVNFTQSSVSLDMIRQWREQLLALVDSLREGMIEF